MNWKEQKNPEKRLLKVNRKPINQTIQEACF